MYGTSNGALYREACSIFSATEKLTNRERLRDSAFFSNDPTDTPNG
jgi:hypothetical protein